MPVEFIGMIRTNNVSEIDTASAPTADAAIDRDFVRDFARAHEDGGFDRVLIGYYSTGAGRLGDRLLRARPRPSGSAS